MFSSLANCTVGPVLDQSKEMIVGNRPVHKIAFLADLISGIALLIIGVLASQHGFLCTEMQYAFIGVGATLIFIMLSSAGMKIKNAYFPDAFIIPPVVVIVTKPE